MKEIKVIDWLYLFILVLIVIYLGVLVSFFINTDNNFSSIGYSRIGIGLGLLISLFWNSSKNKIRKIVIDENFLTFEIVKNFKKSKIQIFRNDIVSCKMNIYTKDSQKINLCFDMSNNNKVEFIDIYHKNISLNVIKQLFILEKYITNFSYYVSSDGKYIISFIENGMKYPLKDKIYNILMTISILIALIITIFCLMNI